MEELVKEVFNQWACYKTKPKTEICEYFKNTPEKVKCIQITNPYTGDLECAVAEFGPFGEKELCFTAIETFDYHRVYKVFEKIALEVIHRRFKISDVKDKYNKYRVKQVSEKGREFLQFLRVHKEDIIGIREETENPGIFSFIPKSRYRYSLQVGADGFDGEEWFEEEVMLEEDKDYLEVWFEDWNRGYDDVSMRPFHLQTQMILTLVWRRLKPEIKCYNDLFPFDLSDFPDYRREKNKNKLGFIKKYCTTLEDLKSVVQEIPKIPEYGGRFKMTVDKFMSEAKDLKTAYLILGYFEEELISLIAYFVKDFLEY